jgi:hypothetical protein
MAFESLLSELETDLRAALDTCITGLVSTARTRLQGAQVDIDKERTKGIAEVEEQRNKALTEVDEQRRQLALEIEAMHTHQEKQQGRVELNIGGYRFETSVQTLRRLPHTFFDAYFSGRYAQDVCADGSIFVDRDGEHFGHVLEYMRDGVLSVAEPGAQPSVALLLSLKREFGFYSMQLYAEQPAEPERRETAFVMGGRSAGGMTADMEQFDMSSGQWSAAAAMSTARWRFGSCVVAGEIYVTGGCGQNNARLASVEKYSPASNTWSTVAPLPEMRSSHTAVAIGRDIYVVGGMQGPAGRPTATTLKFDSTESTWSLVAPMPEPRSMSAACAIGNSIYVFGGADNGFHASTFMLDTVANEWSTLAPMPHVGAYHSASVLDGLVYIIGAGDGHQVLRFDPTLGTWSTLTPMAARRECCSSFVLGGCLYVAGGGSGDAQKSVVRYEVATDTWTAVADMLEGRYTCSAVTIGSSGPAMEQDLFDSIIAKLPSTLHS